MYIFYLSLYRTAAAIPKKDRFTIGVKSENLTLEIIEKFYEANAKFGNDRLSILKIADTKLKILQMLVKALFDVKSINDQRFLKLSEQLIEIGCMLGGWIKSTKS